MFTGKKSAQIREILISESAWEEMTCLFAPSLTVYCAKSQNLGYYLSGTTVDAGNSIFTNTASFSPAQGVGVQLTRNGTIIPANNTVSLGAVGTSAVSLGLTANYARTGGQVTAGNVQSIIGVTFVYQ